MKRFSTVLGEAPMSVASIFLACHFWSGIVQGHAAESLKKTRLAVRSIPSTIQPVIGQRLGFFSEEGIDLEIIVARGTVAVQALVSGSVDYGTTLAIPAILSGAPLKILLISSDKPAHYLVGSPKISHVKQLAGKTMAISDYGGNSFLMTQELLAKNNIPSEAVQLKIIGEQSVRFQALLTGLVDATLLTSELTKLAQAKGFRIIAYTGDFITSLGTELVTTDAKIRTAPAEVLKMVRATLKAQLFLFRNSDEGPKFIMEIGKLSDFSLAKELWHENLRQASELAQIGRANDEAMLINLERVRKQLQSSATAPKIKPSVNPSQVYDFSFAARAYQELLAESWNPLRYKYTKKR